MATETHSAPVPAHPAASPHSAGSTPYILDAVNNARVAAGKRALSKEECDKAIAERPKPVEPPKAALKDPHAKVDPNAPPEPPPPPPPFVESDAQYLVGLPGDYVHPTLDDGRTKTTPPAATRSNA